MAQAILAQASACGRALRKQVARCVCGTKPRSMILSRLSRSATMVVGISIKDIEGSKAAMMKAIDMAQKGTKVIALHVPKLVPEMMLSSMSDPSDVSEDAFASLASLPSKAGDNLMKQVREVAEGQMKTSGKEVEISYRVAAPAGDIKAAVLACCVAEKANFLVIGPGYRGNGGLPLFAVQRAKGMTLCVVRDNLE
uniref:UspA domain-containing protein n=1 Tax=Alexandrium monilatum TaxID=311494 RepID=A0A7S4QDZ3_9DINO